MCQRSVALGNVSVTFIFPMYVKFIWKSSNSSGSRQIKIITEWAEIHNNLCLTLSKTELESIFMCPYIKKRVTKIKNAICMEPIRM